MSYSRHVIGNQRNASARPVYTRSLAQAPQPASPLPPQAYSGYPGLGAPPVSGPSDGAFVPAETAPSSGGLNGLASLFNGLGSGGSGGGSGGGFNMSQLKQVIDRMGGVDGILDTVSKVQRVVEGVQQVAPLVKMIIGFGRKKPEEEAFTRPARRRRHRRRRTRGRRRRR